jgi:hypothetical protein
MKVVAKSKRSKLTSIVAVFLILASLAFGYPPDNAAVLYYKAALLYQPDDEIERAVGDFARGRRQLDDTIINHVEKNRYVIKVAIDASEVKNCDWGIDHSEGMAVVIPPLSPLRKLGWLVNADARILAEQGKYEAALDRCLTVHEMGRHANSVLLIGHLVGVALKNTANECAQALLADMPPDLDTLTWFKTQFMEVQTRPFSLKSAVNTDIQTAMVGMRLENKNELLKLFSDSISPPPAEDALDRIKNADEAFFERNRAYFQDLVSQYLAAFDLPYEQAWTRLKELGERPAKDAVENPDATLAAVWMPATDKIYNHDVKLHTFSNAILAALDIYAVKARTGRLPDKLPEGLPKDMFSGRDFEYVPQDGGFILRCRARDLQEDKVHEYEFRVKN